MQNYVNKVLARIHHPPPIKTQHSPHPYNAPIYFQKCKFVIPTITNEKLTPAQLNHCQEFCGFSIIMLEPLTTPCKQPSVPSPTPFQLAHGNISNVKSINFLTMRPLTLMPKFDIIQAKCTYGFTQTSLISMNQKLALTMVVLLPFWQTKTLNKTKWPSTKIQCTSSCQQQNHRHCLFLCSRIWNWLRFHQHQICCAPSQWPTYNWPHPRSNTN